MCLILIFFYISGCKKEYSSIGDNIIPLNDKIHVNSTYLDSIYAYSDTVGRVYSSNVTKGIAGFTSDPAIGSSTGGFITQFRLSSNGVEFNNTVAAQSFDLILAYNNSYGNPNPFIRFKIYELAEIQDTIYSDYQPDYLPKQIADMYFNKNSLINDTINNNDVSQVLRIPLSLSFAEKILFADDSCLETNSSFLQLIKGLYIKPVKFAAEGMVIFDLASEHTRLELNYIDYSDTSSKSYQFLINSQCIRANLFHHSYFSDLIDTSGTDSLTYLQAMGGVRTIIKFPGIETWKDSGAIAINQAELIIGIDNSSDVINYIPPARIYLYVLLSSNNGRILTDNTYSFGSIVGGNYN
ncbi:MAG: DUF4270 family protein, partial [Bacteroidia bacterium]|nr:DUF4270 family protein [Bacteroidia bacterium]